MRTRPEAPRLTRCVDSRVEALRTDVDVTTFLDDHSDEGFPLFSPATTVGMTMATFCWIGGHDVRWVLLDANGITDRDWVDDAMLENIPGTNLWHISLLLPSDYRGSYCFAVGREGFTRPDGLDPATQRNRWLAILEGAVPDPLNATTPVLSSFGTMTSEAVAPDAPSQRLWSVGTDAPQSLSLHRLVVAGVERDVWSWCSDDDGPGPPRDLAILFDGRTWAERHAIVGSLDAMMKQRPTKHLAVVFIDSVDQATRSRDLTCSDLFRQDLGDIVIPWAQQRLGANPDPARVVVAGQSYGGLAAADFVLERPELARNAICVSGSFWWSPESSRTDWVWDQRFAGSNAGSNAGLDAASLWFWLEAGSHEGDMAELSGRFAESAREASAEVEHSEFCGGHDAVQWRESLLRGLERFVDRQRVHKRTEQI